MNNYTDNLETDSDAHKGAVESDKPSTPTDESFAGQLGHRDQDSLLKDNDSDYPEPGSNPEHSGQHK